MNPLDKLTDIFERFPGIGPKQAQRFVQFLLLQPQGLRNDLAATIRELGDSTQQCESCFRWFAKSGRERSLCNICADEHRDAGTIFIVEKDVDIPTVEHSGFKGKYFVLGGLVPLAFDETQKYIRMRQLLERVKKDTSSSTLHELILGLSATREGDHTSYLILEVLRPFAEQYSFTLSSLGRGLSTGSELEYADPDTIARALATRREQES